MSLTGVGVVLSIIKFVRQMHRKINKQRKGKYTAEYSSYLEKENSWYF